MNKKPAVERRLRRLYVLLSLAWAILWASGIGVVSTVAVRLSSSALQRDFDAELALVATATYSLAYFDHEGKFDDSFFLSEPDLTNSIFDIWIVELGSPPQVHLAPRDPFFQFESLTQLATNVVETQVSAFENISDEHNQTYRVHTKATYDEGEYDVARAAIIVVGDPQSVVLSQQEFVKKLALVGAFIGLLGLMTGIALVFWGLRPVAASFKARERFLSLIAHELRNPVAALKGIKDSALAGDENAETAMSRIGPLVDQTGQVVEDLLLFARLDVSDPPLELQKFRLDLLAETCLHEGSAVQFDAQESVVVGDPRLFKVLIRNLIENAIRHSGMPEETVRLKIRAGEILVQDNGPGFPEYVLAVGGDFSAIPSQGGIGLGLAISRLIARLHGGELVLDNLPDGGACAKFQFSSDDVS